MSSKILFCFETFNEIQRVKFKFNNSVGSTLQLLKYYEGDYNCV